MLSTVIAGSHTTWCLAPKALTPQGSPTRPSSTRRSNTSHRMKQTSCTCESRKRRLAILSNTSIHFGVFNKGLYFLPSPPLSAFFWDDTLPGICHYSGPLLNKPSVRGLFSLPRCEQISSEGPCSTDNRPVLHLASGITTHLASHRYRSQISAWMNWIHIPSVCSGKSDIYIIHGHPRTKTVQSERLLESKSGEGVESFSLWVSAFGFKWLTMCYRQKGFGCHYWWSNLSAWRPATAQLHMIKEAGAHRVATPRTLPHHWLRATRRLLFLVPVRHRDFPLLCLNF